MMSSWMGKIVQCQPVQNLLAFIADRWEQARRTIHGACLKIEWEHQYLHRFADKDPTSCADCVLKKGGCHWIFNLIFSPCLDHKSSKTLWGSPRKLNVGCVFLSLRAGNLFTALALSNQSRSNVGKSSPISFLGGLKQPSSYFTHCRESEQGPTQIKLLWASLGRI